MYTVYVYDKNWISVAEINPISENELETILEKIKAGGFNVNAVKNQEN